MLVVSGWMREEKRTHANVEELHVGEVFGVGGRKKDGLTVKWIVQV